MKEYHTSIQIDGNIAKVWEVLTNFENYSNWNPLVKNLSGTIKEGGVVETEITPMNKTFKVKLTSYKKDKEMIWVGKQGARFLLSGEHYYKLVPIDENKTKLLHGEVFTGILSGAIKPALIDQMTTAFNMHNEALKKVVEGTN